MSNSIKEFGGVSGVYSIELIIGDASISNPTLWRIGDLSLMFPEAAASSSSQDYTYKVGQGSFFFSWLGCCTMLYIHLPHSLNIWWCVLYNHTGHCAWEISQVDLRTMIISALPPWTNIRFKPSKLSYVSCVNNHFIWFVFLYFAIPSFCQSFVHFQCFPTHLVNSSQCWFAHFQSFSKHLILLLFSPTLKFNSSGCLSTVYCLSHS